MAIIGKFTLSGGKFTGTIETLALKAKVVFQPEEAGGENAPSHRIYSGKSEIGAAWQKTSKAGLAYLSVKLDDPSFPAPVFASLFAEDTENMESKAFNLVWQRS